MTSLSFRERMDGWVAFGQPDASAGWYEGRRTGGELSLRLRIDIDDVDAFRADPVHAARVTGWAQWPALGGTLTVEEGTWNLFVDLPDPRHRQMRYALRLRDAEGHVVELTGFKALGDDPNHDVWSDTTTLYTTVTSGAEPLAAGVLRVRRGAFARQLTTFRARGGSAFDRVRAPAAFGRLFAQGLWEVYRGPPVGDDEPDFPTLTPHAARWQGHEPGAWHELGSRPGVRRRILGLVAGDGAQLTLHQLRGPREPTKGPVLVSHGCATRANLFYDAPGTPSLVDALLEAGHDVWVQNWRGSIDLPPRDWTLDDVAVHDHPATVRRVLAETGARTLQAVVHCQGSTSFAMAAIAGLLPEVTTIVANAVTLHVDVTPGSARKQALVVPLVRPVVRGADVQWAARAPSTVAAGFALAARMARHECHDPRCAMANFLYGTGPDVLWRHDHLTRDVHDWLDREVGYTPMSFFAQMRDSVQAGHVLPTGDHAALPRDLLTDPPATDARFVLLAGTANRCFLPRSQERTHAWLDGHAPGRHRLLRLEGYSHMDAWFGRDAHRDVHPHVVAALA